MKIVSVILFVVVLAGCGPTQEQITTRTQAYMDSLAVAESNAKACLEGIKTADSGYHRLTEAFILNTDHNNELYKTLFAGYASAQNIEDYKIYRRSLQKCIDQMLKDYSNVDYRYVNNLAGKRTQSDDNLIKLLGNEITIGDRNKFLARIITRYEEDKADINRDIVDELSNLSDSEIQRNRSIAKQMFDSSEEYRGAELIEQKLQSLQPVPLPQPPKEVVTTD